MSNKIVRGTLSSAVADAGTFAVSYPARTSPGYGTTNAGDFSARGHVLILGNGNKYVAFDDFTVTFGTSTVTITNASGATWPANTDYTLQLNERGPAIYFDKDPNGQNRKVAQTVRAGTYLVRLGAPDVLDADGICASQSVAANASFLINGALASGGVVDLDVPRCVQAAWTTTAVITITGKDVYGNTMVEASASGTSHTGTKAFARITGITSSASITSATVGTNDVLGLPTALQQRQDIVAELFDGSLGGDAAPRVIQPFEISATALAAATAQQFIAPFTGRLTRVQSVVQTALPATAGELGTVNLTVNGTAVSGSTLTTYSTAGGGNGSVGDVATAEIPLAATTAAVTAGDAVAVVPSSTWASGGALNGFFEMVPTGMAIYRSGTIVAAITTSGGSTATTGDVRGTYQPPFACDGSITVDLVMRLTDPGDIGIAQYAG